MKLYYIDAADPDDLFSSFALFVSAESTEEAVQFWRDYFDVGPDEEQIQIFLGDVLPPEAGQSLANDSGLVTEEICRIYEVERGTVKGIIDWHGVPNDTGAVILRGIILP